MQLPQNLKTILVVSWCFIEAPRYDQTSPSLALWKLNLCLISYLSTGLEDVVLPSGPGSNRRVTRALCSKTPHAATVTACKSKAAEQTNKMSSRLRPRLKPGMQLSITVLGMNHVQWFAFSIHVPPSVVPLLHTGKEWITTYICIEGKWGSLNWVTSSSTKENSLSL